MYAHEHEKKKNLKEVMDYFFFECDWTLGG